VHTKLHERLHGLQNTDECNAVLRHVTQLEAPTFVVTTLSEPLASKFADSHDGYRKTVWQLQARDLSLLESLSYDRSFATKVGLHNLRSYVVDLAWKVRAVLLLLQLLLTGERAGVPGGRAPHLACPAVAQNSAQRKAH
jgi:hypothetical protein